MESLNQWYLFFSICICLGALSCSDVELDRIAFLEVITVGVTDLGTSEVTLIGNAENLKNAKISESGFVLSRINKDDLSLRIDQSENLIEGSSGDVLKDEGVFLSKITGLTSSSTYYYRAYLMIEEEAQPAYGAIDSFSTLQLDIALLSIARTVKDARRM